MDGAGLTPTDQPLIPVEWVKPTRGYVNGRSALIGSAFLRFRKNMISARKVMSCVRSEIFIARRTCVILGFVELRRIVRQIKINQGQTCEI